MLKHTLETKKNVRVPIRVRHPPFASRCCVQSHSPAVASHTTVGRRSCKGAAIPGAIRRGDQADQSSARQSFARGREYVAPGYLSISACGGRRNRHRHLIRSDPLSHPSMPSIFPSPQPRDPSGSRASRRPARAARHGRGVSVTQHRRLAVSTPFPFALLYSCPSPVPPRIAANASNELQRYVMSDDLPEGCQLRVRAAPSPDADELLVVTCDDEIYASEQQGDWLRVELPGEHRVDWRWGERARQTPKLQQQERKTAAPASSSLPPFC